MTLHVFTYGSLMFAPVWQRVVRGQYRQEQARASGYARFAVRNADYPGMVVHIDGVVPGVIYFDVDEWDLRALDAFEGADYIRENIEVQVETGPVVQASTYIYLPTAQLEPTPWQPEAFQLQAFLRTYCGE
jgi:gamma-glutamylcyclotransferase (GGCT)/AIG2-like uncharacterized protein YtfP